MIIGEQFGERGMRDLSSGLDEVGAVLARENGARGRRRIEIIRGEREKGARPVIRCACEDDRH